MTVYFGMFDDVRKYSAAEFARIIQSVSASGIAYGIANGLVPTAGAGYVNVASGMAILQGYYYFSDATQVVTLNTAPTTVGNSRIDRVIIRLTISTKTLVLTKLNGVETTSASAVPFALTNTADVYEISLCQARMNYGATNPIITDERPQAGPGVHDMLTGHSKTGLTVGQVIRASAVNAFGFDFLQAIDLPAITQFGIVQAPGAPSVSSAAMTAFTNTPTITITTTGGRLLMFAYACVTWAAANLGGLSILRSGGGAGPTSFTYALGGGTGFDVTMFVITTEFLPAGTYTYYLAGFTGAGSQMKSDYTQGMGLCVLELKK